MKFVCYTEWNQLPASANALFEQGEKESIFLSRPWFESLTAAALDDDHTMVLACVQAGDVVTAILPLMQSAGNTWYSLRHGYTPLYSLLLADVDQEQVLSCLAQGLSESRVNGLLLEPVANDGKLALLQKILGTEGYRCDQIFRGYNWIYRLQEQTFEVYMAGRPAKLRNTISRKKRKLERDHGYTIRLFTGNDVPHGMSDYETVYDASWKQNEPDNARFQDCLVEAFSKAGWSRLAVLYVKEQPVAAQLWFVHQGKASIFRLAYDKKWRQYSTGSILTSFLMEYVIDTDKVEEIDFLTGNDAYKQDWMSERRERFVLSCKKIVRPPSKYELVVGSMKRILKSIRRW
jgi:hypothetical protein